MAVPVLLAIASTFWFACVWAGMGSLLFRLVTGRSAQTSLERLCAMGLGYGCIGNALMLLCFLGQAHPPVIIATLVLCTLTGVPFLRTWPAFLMRQASRVPRVWKTHPLLCSVLALMMTGYAVLGLGPPVDFDGLMYHLPTVKLYMQEGGFWDIYFNAQSDYPMLAQMHYMAGMALNNDIICKTVAFSVGVMLISGIGAMGRAWLTLSGPQVLLAMLLFATFTPVMAGLPTCNVDLAQALWMLLSLHALESGIRKGDRRMIVLAALFAGMTVQTKVFGALLIPVLCLRLLVHFLKIKNSKPLSNLLVPCIVIITIAGAMGAPWFAKSYAYNGTILAVRHTAIQGQGLARPMNSSTDNPVAAALINTVGRTLAAPWTFSFFPGQHQGDTFGPLPLAILPFLLLTGVSLHARFLLLCGAGYWAMVLFMEMVFIQGGSSIRYSTFLLAIAALFIPYTLGRLAQKNVIRRILAVMTGIMIALSVLLFLKRYHREWIAFATNASRDAYYTALVPEYPVIRRINGIADGRLVMPVYNYGEYLIDVPYITAYRSYPNADEMRRDLREKNIGYIFANDKFDTLSNQNPFPQIRNKKFVMARNGFYLYELLREDTK
ncbi:MAG: hypothetical protein JW768_13450 [Chitinispirillaceae bacterium]|nr:hypothetical protein [Chitinispirillaceae bacterium]